MTEQELGQRRREKWRLNGNAIRTLEDAAAWLEEVGFCQIYPSRPGVNGPTFVGAWVGNDDRLPIWQRAFSDPRAAEATELMVRLLRQKAAYEANLFEENQAFLVAASVFPFFYALVGEKNPRQAPKPGPRSEYSQLAADAFEAIRREGPISRQRLLDSLGKGVSVPALDKALAELWSKLRITRVDYKPGEGAFWDELYRWAPDQVREGISYSVVQALSALLSKYLDCMVAADQQEIEDFFSNFVSRARVKEAINALLAARELSFVHVGHRSLIQITPPKQVPIRRVSGTQRARS
jgi:23S rRNA pseudouridine2605 synthase